MITLQVSSEHAGSRLDHFLVLAVPESSRSLLVQSIRLGLIVVDGAKKKSSYRLKDGEIISGTFYEPPVPQLTPQNIPFDILFEDEHLLLISKPPGLVVHPGSGNPDRTLVNGLLYYCKNISDVGDELRPGIVHRLDKDTSGIMVVAKTSQCHRILVQAFKGRAVEKVYIALLRGYLDRKTGRIVAPINRHPVNRQKMAVCERKGRYAASNWQVTTEYEEGFSLVNVGIETGRTHQIRVHMASIGHPVAGDALYGRGGDKHLFKRQMLHAGSLSFGHPLTGEEMSFQAPLPEDFKDALSGLTQRSQDIGEQR